MGVADGSYVHVHVQICLTARCLTFQVLCRFSSFYLPAHNWRSQGFQLANSAKRLCAAHVPSLRTSVDYTVILAVSILFELIQVRRILCYCNDALYCDTMPNTHSWLIIHFEYFCMYVGVHGSCTHQMFVFFAVCRSWHSGVVKVHQKIVSCIIFFVFRMSARCTNYLTALEQCVNLTTRGE